MKYLFAFALSMIFSAHLLADDNSLSARDAAIAMTYANFHEDGIGEHQMRIIKEVVRANPKEANEAILGRIRYFEEHFEIYAKRGRKFPPSVENIVELTHETDPDGANLVLTELIRILDLSVKYFRDSAKQRASSGEDTFGTEGALLTMFQWKLDYMDLKEKYGFQLTEAETMAKREIMAEEAELLEKRRRDMSKTRASQTSIENPRNPTAAETLQQSNPSSGKAETAPETAK